MGGLDIAWYTFDFPPYNFTKDFPKSQKYFVFFSYSPVHLWLFDNCLSNKEFIFTFMSKYNLDYSRRF